MGNVISDYRPLSEQLPQLNQKAWLTGEGVSPSYEAQREFVRRQREMSSGSAQQQQEAVNMMRGIATGDSPTMAEQQSALAARNIRQGARSALSAGSFDPMAVRASQMGQAQALGELGAQTGISAGQERQQAMANYLAATGQQRAAGLSENQLMRDEAIKREQLAQNWQTIGIGDRQSSEKSAQEYEKLKQAREFDIMGQVMGFRTATTQPYYERTGAEKALDAWSNVFSDERTKKNISSAQESVDKYFSALKESKQDFGAIKEVDQNLYPQAEVSKIMSQPEPDVNTMNLKTNMDSYPVELKPQQPQDLDAAGSAQAGGGVDIGSKLMSSGNPIAAAIGAGLKISGSFAKSFSEEPTFLRGSSTPIRQRFPGQIYSDENTKKNISDANIDDFLRKISPKEFEYKKEYQDEMGPGKRVGVTTQDLEKSEIGGLLVDKNSDGIGLLNTSSERFNPVVLASLARFSDRLDRLEGKKNG